MKTDPTELLEQVARLRRERDERARTLERARGAYAQLIKDLKARLGTDDPKKAAKILKQRECELEELEALLRAKLDQATKEAGRVAKDRRRR